MSKIKFFIAETIYSKALDEIYRSSTFLIKENYEMQYGKILNTGFGWSGYWKTNLEKDGGFIVEEQFVNAENLQKKWADERNVSYNHGNYCLDILEEQIKLFNPDIVFDNTAGFVDAEFWLKIKEKYPSVKLVVGWDGVAQNDVNKFSHVDVVLSPLEHVVDFYKKNGFKTFQFQLAFESTILDKIERREQLYDVSFVGSVFVGKDFHIRRLRFLANLSRRINLQLWCSGLPKYSFSWQQIKRLLRGEFRNFADVRRLISVNKGELFGLRMLQVLADSKITLNNHIDSAVNKAGNFRLFEATGVGSCLLTDWKENIGDFFELDKEVVVYNSIVEAIDKIKYLLENESARKKIALAGQKRTQEDHSFDHRIINFTKFLLDNL